VGLLTFHAPQITALALVIYIAAWALMIGASEIVDGSQTATRNKGRMVADSDGVGINCFRRVCFCGILSLAPPQWIWLIAWYAVVLGILAIFFGFRLRSLRALPVS